MYDKHLLRYSIRKDTMLKSGIHMNERILLRQMFVILNNYFR
jgi:hypothetical protein